MTSAESITRTNELRSTPLEHASLERARALAARLQHGARTLAALAERLSEDEWQTRVPGDGRKIGVVVHHVASVYPLEIALAQKVARGESIADVTMDDVHVMNAEHAKDNDNVSKAAAIDLLQRNSAAAAEVVRTLTDEQLDRATLISLYEDAPVTCQFLLEDHAVRHSYHHRRLIERALERSARARGKA